MPSDAERGSYNVVAAEDEHAEETEGSVQCYDSLIAYRPHFSPSRHRLLLAVVGALLLAAVYLYLTAATSKRRTPAEDASHLIEPSLNLGHPIRRQYAVSADSVSLFRHRVSASGLVDSYNNTLMVGLTNYGYRDFTYNWLCYVRRHNLTNFLLACVDVQSCDELRLLGYGRHALLLDELIHDPTLAAQCGGGSGTHDYRSACFNRQTKSKALLVLTSLLAGYNTVLTDMDISLVHNPFLYMPLSFDWEVQLEPHELCTGWYYNAASPIAIRMQTEVLHAMAQHPDMDDQVAYNVWAAYQLYVSSDADVRQYVFPLSRELFPIGQHFGGPHAVLWHNNWLESAKEKRQRLRDRNMYLYQEAETAAAAAAYVAQLPFGMTSVDEKGVRSPIWRSVNGSGVAATPPSVPLLVCASCAPCVGLTPSVPPLRSTFPGPLLTHDFADYTAPWPEPLIDRIK